MRAGMRLRNARSPGGNTQTQGQWSLRLINGIADALAAISHEDLQCLRAKLNAETIAVPALLEWLDAAIDWELNRRTGRCRTLQDPRLTISTQDEIEASLIVLTILYAQLRDVEGATDFLDVTAGVLCTVDGAGMPATLH